MNRRANSSQLLGIFSSSAGLVIVLFDMAFAIWAGIGKAWYIYPFNFLLLFTASSFINTSYIQGMTRGFSCIYLYGIKGVPEALFINIPTVIYMVIAYFITYFVFAVPLQKLLFFGGCIVLSTIVAIADGHFRLAVERTRMFERSNS